MSRATIGIAGSCGSAPEDKLKEQASEVAHKDRAALIWCENATMLTGDVRRYLKVPQKEFEKLQPKDFGDLLALENT
jgi:hypothetical protein